VGAEEARRRGGAGGRTTAGWLSSAGATPEPRGARRAHRAGDATGNGGADPTGNVVAVGLAAGAGFEK